MHLRSEKIHWNRAETNLNVGILLVQFWGTLSQVWDLQCYKQHCHKMCSASPSPAPQKTVKTLCGFKK